MRIQLLTYNTHGLPWSKNNSRDIAVWIGTVLPDIVCLQEVFCAGARTSFSELLTQKGYTVYVPHDKDVTLLTSGLITAVYNTTFQFLRQCFCSFQAIHNVEWFANKGFHVVRLVHRATGRTISIANTHTQSSTEISWLFRSTVVTIRKAQIQQMLDFFEHDRYPVLIAGDFNCDVSPNPHLRFLQPPNESRLKKRTFYSTDEELDHIAWIPLQWAKKGCMFCDVVHRGPMLESCTIFQKPWSDHAPVLASIRIPPL